MAAQSGELSPTYLFDLDSGSWIAILPTSRDLIGTHQPFQLRAYVRLAV